MSEEFDPVDKSVDDEFDFEDDYSEFEDKYDYLEEEYEDRVGFEPIAKSRDPEGSLTDNLRFNEPRRNGAHKRNREAQRKMKENNARSKWGTDHPED